MSFMRFQVLRKRRSYQDKKDVVIYLFYPDFLCYDKCKIIKIMYCVHKNRLTKN